MSFGMAAIFQFFLFAERLRFYLAVHLRRIGVTPGCTLFWYAATGHTLPRGSSRAI